jgi:hypothetical protein
MGNRGNIEICQPIEGKESGEVTLYLYTHWTGDTVCETLAKALDDNRGRWNTPDYMTRIIFNELQGDDRSSRGFGIAAWPAADAQYPTPQLYWTTRTTKFETQTADEPMVWYETDIMTADEFIEKFLPANKGLLDTQEIPVVTG